MTVLWNRVAGDEMLVLVTNVFVQITLLAALALMVARLFRHAAPIRHGILLSAVLSVSAIPLLTTMLQLADLSVVAIPVKWDLAQSMQLGDLETGIAPVIPATSGSEDVEAWGDARISAAEGSLLLDPVLPSSANDGDGTEARALIPQRHLRSAAAIVLVVWLLGVLVAFLGIARSGWKVRRIVRRARPFDLAVHGGVVGEVCRILDLKSLPQVACSSDVVGPAVVGIVRPLIVLPSRLVSILSARELRDVLLHETAHVLRRDKLIALLQQILGAIFWPHPLVHFLNRQLACAREDVCDNYVLATANPADYGETLLRLGQLMSQPRLLTGSVGMFNIQWKLEDRIAELLDKRRTATIRLRPTSIAMILVSALLLLLAIAGSQIVRAKPSVSEWDGMGGEAVSQAVDRMLAFLQQRGEPAVTVHLTSLSLEEAQDDGAVELGSAENLSSAVGRTVDVLGQPPVQGVVAGERLALYVIDVITGEVTLVADEPNRGFTYCGSPSWSNDGQRIVFDATPGTVWHKTRLQMIDVTGTRAGLRSLGPGNCPTLSPDGKHIAFRLRAGALPAAEPGVWIMDADGTNRRRLGDGGGMLKWSPDGRQLLIVSFSSPRLTLMDVETGEQRPVKLAGHKFFSVPNWTGDGQVIVTVVRSDTGSGLVFVDIAKPEQAQVKQVVWRSGDRLDLNGVACPVYSAKTGRCVFIGKDENGMALYMVQPSRFDPPKRLEPNRYDHKMARPVFSPDGRYVLFCSDRLHWL